MESISKTRIDADMAQAMIARTLGANYTMYAIRELTGGFFNAAYQIDLENGQRCVLKIAPPPNVLVMSYERDLMRAEVESMRMAKQRTKLPVPAILAYDDSLELLSSPYCLMEFVAGEPLNECRPRLSEAQQYAIDRRMGEYTRELHTIHGETFGYLAQLAAPGRLWKEVFGEMFSRMLADGEAIGTPLPYAVLRELAARHADVLNEVRTPQLIHWDLWDGNIFIDPETAEICAIIDFERALWGDPLMEPQFREHSGREAFYAGYGADILASPGARRRKALYDLYFYCILIIECDYRQYPTREQAAWANGYLQQVIDKLKQGE